MSSAIEGLLSSSPLPVYRVRATQAQLNTGGHGPGHQQRDRPAAHLPKQQRNNLCHRYHGPAPWVGPSLREAVAGVSAFG